MLYELRQSSPYRRARAELQKKKLFQRERMLLLFRISDLYDDIEIDNGFEKRELCSLEFPDSPQGGE